jgi:hypothetical protein
MCRHHAAAAGRAARLRTFCLRPYACATRAAISGQTGSPGWRGNCYSTATALHRYPTQRSPSVLYVVLAVVEFLVTRCHWCGSFVLIHW